VRDRSRQAGRDRRGRKTRSGRRRYRVIYRGFVDNVVDDGGVVDVGEDDVVGRRGHIGWGTDVGRHRHKHRHGQNEYRNRRGRWRQYNEVWLWGRQEEHGRRWRRRERVDWVVEREDRLLDMIERNAAASERLAVSIENLGTILEREERRP